jgi:paraquat-inducible protein B
MLFSKIFIVPQIRNCCDKMPVWLIPIILLSLAVMMVSYFS